MEWWSIGVLNDRMIGWLDDWGVGKPSRSRLGMRVESWKVVLGERGCGRLDD